MAEKHLIHTHSNEIAEDMPKLPSNTRIKYGELAVNYAKGYETISLKNDNDEIITFSNDNIIKKMIEDNERVISSALIDLNERLTELEGINNILDEINGEVI